MDIFAKKFFIDNDMIKTLGGQMPPTADSHSARVPPHSYPFVSCPTPDDAAITASLAGGGSFPHPGRIQASC
jgi:hypothetical protein